MSTAADAPTHPGTASYLAGEGPVGVLLCHGFTSTPQAVRPWADHLLGAGYAVSVPLLPGHGTSWQELNATPWTAWYDCVDEAFRALRGRCERVAVAGLSLGGGLALRLAEEHGDAVAALSLVNPCVHSADVRMRVLGLLRHLGSLPGIGDDVLRPGPAEVCYDRNPLHALHSATRLWALTRAELGRVSAPTQIFKSRRDHVVDPSSLRMIQQGLRVAPEVVLLERSYHVATLDHDAETIFARSAEFIGRAVGDRA